MDVGEIIYKAFVPTLKMMTTISVGFGLAKSGIFPPTAAKGVSVVTMNVSLPCLIFSSTVQAFTPQNISAFGGLVWAALMYELIGGVLACIIREVFYVPIDFYWGIIVCGALSNWVNVPTAVVQTVGNNEPFRPGDVELGIAYISVFSFVFCIVLFPLGLHKLCALDFQPEHLARAEPLPFRQRWQDRIARLRRWRGARASQRVAAAPAVEPPQVVESFDDKYSDDAHRPSHDDGAPAALSRGRSLRGSRGTPDNPAPQSTMGSGSRQMLSDTGIARRTSRVSFSSIRPIPPTAPLVAVGITQPCPPGCAHARPRPSPRQSGPSPAVQDPTAGQSDPVGPSDLAISLAPPPPEPLEPVCSDHSKRYDYHEPLPASGFRAGQSSPAAAAPGPSIALPPPSLASSVRTNWRRRLWRMLLTFLRSLLMPISLAVLVSIPCALIQPIKALFTPVPGWTGDRIANTPDGRPPLGWLLETATFIGGVCIPAGLLLLGAGFARLKNVFRIKGQPVAAMVTMAFCKMLVMPVIGVFFIRNQPGVYPPQDRMLTFVCILLSGTPAAVNQMIITQLYNPDGTAHTLSRFLLIQYLLMPILSTALAAIALYVSIR